MLSRAMPQPGQVHRNYKTMKCRFWDAGTCRMGDLCNFAHSDKEILQNTAQKFQGGLQTVAGPFGASAQKVSTQQLLQQDSLPMGSVNIFLFDRIQAHLSVGLGRRCTKTNAIV